MEPARYLSTSRLEERHRGSERGDRGERLQVDNKEATRAAQRPDRAVPTALDQDGRVGDGPADGGSDSREIERKEGEQMGMLAGEAQDARLINHAANLVLPVRSCLIRLVPIKPARREAARRPFTVLSKQGLGSNGACDTQPGQEPVTAREKNDKRKLSGVEGMRTPSELREVLQGRRGISRL